MNVEKERNQASDRRTIRIMYDNSIFGKKRQEPERIRIGGGDGSSSVTYGYVMASLFAEIE